ncbi:MAG TPA: DUF1579 family protein [Acidobacteriota bacterium]|nr:DUF1579 family protein [Acidobacteriota bacterium]
MPGLTTAPPRLCKPGEVDSAGKVFTFEGEFTSPSGKTGKMKEIYRVESPARHVMEMYMVGPDGKEPSVWRSSIPRNDIAGKASAAYCS